MVWDEVIDQVEAVAIGQTAEPDISAHCSLSQLVSEVTNENGSSTKVLSMYMLDAYEDYKSPG